MKVKNATPGQRRGSPVDKPLDVDAKISWGSDVAAQVLRRLDIRYIALTPGASYRGLHDSLVNHLGNFAPEMLMCLHEEHAVAIAHGYAKATGEPMAVALHSNVGLLHGSMAVFNAWCDRAPMLIIGATGPVDATLRRPWIDWIHTSQDQGALLRNFVKWDDQPGSVAALPESIYRAWQQTATAPHAPVYVCLDAAIQEQALTEEVRIPDPRRYRPAPASRPDAQALREAAAILARSRNTVILFGRGRRTQQDWDRRVALAERLGAAMLSDLKVGSMVPTDHPLHVGEPFNQLSRPAKAALQAADVILSLGWVDLGGALRQAFGRDSVPATVIHAGDDIHLHNGWGKEHMELPAIDVHLLGDADAAVADLLEALPPGRASARTAPAETQTHPDDGGDRINLHQVATALAQAVGEQPVTFAALPRAWPVTLWQHRHPLDYLGKDGGGGVGSGPGTTIGAALALEDSARLTIGILGDGDCIMSINALWTAAHYRIPALFIIANNRSYYNDELHQEGVARTRGRNTANRWIGQRIDNPAPDIAKMAEAQGLTGIGPVTRIEDLKDVIRRGVECVRGGNPCLIDVHIDPGHGRHLRESMAERSMAKGS
ncbi:MAG: acetolactate synthase [Betaproteobacteria bacterium RIFCSPLOWO2_02_FULL_63_19]|nr:MAG: acetolactate synthase [Betaproteobacteria bacterium RIFCSPLOWO2_02_FULL_63_19]